MKLIIAIVQSEDAEQVAKTLLAKGFEATKISTMGGFLRRENVTILTAVEDAQVEEALSLIRDNCQRRTKYVHPLVPLVGTHEPYVVAPVPVEVGGATVLVVNLERFEKL